MDCVEDWAESVIFQKGGLGSRKKVPSSLPLGTTISLKIYFLNLIIWPNCPSTTRCLRISPHVTTFSAACEKLISLHHSFSHSKVITVIRHLGKRCGLLAPRCVYSAESAWNWAPHSWWYDGNVRGLCLNICLHRLTHTLTLNDPFQISSSGFNIPVTLRLNTDLPKQLSTPSRIHTHVRSRTHTHRGLCGLVYRYKASLIKAVMTLCGSLCIFSM